MQEKKCSKCGEVKEVSEFHKKRKNKSGLCPWCKNCEKKRYLLWYENNFQRVIDNANKWKTNNKEKRKEILSKYYNNNKEKIKSTANYKLNDSISSGLRQSLNKNKAGHHWETIVGYTIDQLKKHLEKQFKNGMTWENYGRYGWHIDHIIPVSAHNFQTPEDIDFKKCWSLKNLQPMWAKENIKKSNKLSKPFQPSLTL